ncbi:MAG: YkgJ family cysteine cluster protein [Candidatus Pacearchaeota archaeon]|jgi:Fe-S-cluster containining protein
MDKDIQKIYDLLSRISIFKDMPQCKTCGSSCAAPQWMSWLLPEEVKRFEDYGMKLIKIGNVTFLKKGYCSLHKKNIGCTVYNDRALECRLNPVLFLKINGELWWILIKYCPIVSKANKEELDKIKIKVKSYVKEVEKLITPKIKKEMEEISDTINTFENLIENKDYIKVVKFD